MPDNNENEKIQKNEKQQVEKKNIKGSKFLKKNIFFIFLILFTFFVIVLNQYDKKNKDTINVVVDPKLTTETEQTKTSQKKLTIFVYNQETKTVEEKEVATSEQKNLIEGDYINQVIKNSSYIPENMKFQSAYVLNDGGKKVLKVVLNSEFEGLKIDEELFEGFSKAITETIKKRDSSIEEVKLEVDGVN